MSFCDLEELLVAERTFVARSWAGPKVAVAAVCTKELGRLSRREAREDLRPHESPLLALLTGDPVQLELLQV